MTIMGLGGVASVQIQLYRIDDILPGDVCRRRHRTHGVEVCPSHPDGQNGVLLRQALRPDNAVAATTPYGTSHGKLYQAQHQRNQRQGHHARNLGGGLGHDEAHRAAHDDNQRNGPNVERYGLMPPEAMAQMLDGLTIRNMINFGGPEAEANLLPMLDALKKAVE